MYASLQEYIDRLDREGELVRIAARSIRCWRWRDCRPHGQVAGRWPGPAVRTDGNRVSRADEPVRFRPAHGTGAGGGAARRHCRLHRRTVARGDGSERHAGREAGGAAAAGTGVALVPETGCGGAEPVTRPCGGGPRPIWAGCPYCSAGRATAGACDAADGAYGRPRDGVPNVGMYRMQLFDGQTTGMHWHMHKTGARHYEAWRRAGRRMPVSVCLGRRSGLYLCGDGSAARRHRRIPAGGVPATRPVRLVRCLTNELWVPDDCDFVIEGYVDPAEEKAVEGPFGDHTGSIRSRTAIHSFT